MSLLKSFRMIFTLNTLIVSILAVLSTYLCIRYQLYADFPLTLIGIAVVFPVVFSIGGAYARREKALNYYGSLKAHGRALFFACRDWLPDSKKEHQERLKNILRELLISCRELFNTDEENSYQMERIIYSKFSELSAYIKECKEKGMSAGEASRMNQYLSKMLDPFENMKHIYQYRTPITLRAYSKIFIFVLPVFYGPYFANLGQDVPEGLIYIMPVLFSIILVSLDNIQDHLENPFDLVGEDDVRINVEKLIDTLDL